MKKNVNFSKKQKANSRKSKINSTDWFNISQKILQDNKKDFTLWNKLKAWRNRDDIDKKVCRLLIKQMQEKKVPAEAAYSLTQLASSQIKGFQGQIFKFLFLFLLSLALVLVSGFLFFKQIPYTLDINVWLSSWVNWLIWGLTFAVSIVCFVLISRRRKEFENSLLGNMCLVQASAAYASAHMPGKGGSIHDAYRQLELIKAETKKQSPLNQLRKKK